MFRRFANETASTRFVLIDKLDRVGINSCNPFLRSKRAVGDENVQLTNFYIVEGNENDDFYIDGGSGELLMLQKLNYEETPQFMLKVLLLKTCLSHNCGF